jgi:23S rRNA (adenine2030-N6)-methyltransferase
MNYRHAFHAGNFADVFKHALLARILVYLTRKDAPLRFLDTHAGVGRYDLTGSEAQRSGEWRFGVARLKDADPPTPVAKLLEPYLKAVGPLDAQGRTKAYPGSPAIAQALLRPQDRISLCELHPEDRAALVAQMGHDAKLSIAEIDGYVALNAWLPPKERRGIVLIDPPYEEANEGKRATEALARALAKWPTGTYALWRPIKDRRDDARFLNGIAAIGAPNILQCELDVGHVEPTKHSPEPLTRTGLIVVNPPHGLIDEARALLPWLAHRLAREGHGASTCSWLTPPV